MMRHLVVFLLFSSLGAWAQSIPSGQTRQVRSSADIDSNVGSPLVAVVPDGDEILGWSIISETNTGATGIDPAELFFDIDNDGQITVLQNLGRMFEQTTSTSLTITLNVRAFFTVGMPDDETIAIRVIEDVNTPVIAPGQTRNVVVTTDAGVNVGSPLSATNSPDNWSIINEDNWVNGQVTGVGENERFFDIDDSGQITVLQTLERFFNSLAARGDQLEVTLTVAAFLDTGGSATEDITIYVIEGTTPAVLGTQTRSCTTDYALGTNLQGPLQAIGNPTYWSIVGGSLFDDGDAGVSADAVFSIDNSGQIETAMFLDQFFYNANPFTVTLSVVAGSIYGESAPTDITITVGVVGNIRCGYVTPTQTRYVSSIAEPGTNIGSILDLHGIDSVWIDAAWLDGDIVPNTTVASYFTIVQTGSGLGQISTSRDLSLEFDPDLITRVRLRVRGHLIPTISCPEFSDEEIFVYVLPSDADPDGGGGGGGGTPDFSNYIDDPSLLRCVREKLGLVGGDPLLAADVVGMTHLDCGCRNDDPIADLDGLHLFTGLTELNLANNFISDIRPVGLLTNLTDINLAGNLISDITTSNPFAALSLLENIDLSNNDIRNTNAFSGMNLLRWISLANNDACDIASLVSLTGNGGLGNGDTVIIEGNPMLTANGQTQIAALQNAGVEVFFSGIFGPCPPARPLGLPTWPDHTVLDFTFIVSENAGIACN